MTQRVSRNQQEITELHDDATVQSYRRGGFESILAEVGISEAEWTKWQFEDVIDTLANLSKEHGDHVGPEVIGAVVLTHVRLAWQIGYLLGKGEIG